MRTTCLNVMLLPETVGVNSNHTAATSYSITQFQELTKYSQLTKYNEQLQEHYMTVSVAEINQFECETTCTKFNSD